MREPWFLPSGLFSWPGAAGRTIDDWTQSQGIQVPDKSKTQRPRPPHGRWQQLGKNPRGAGAGAGAVTRTLVLVVGRGWFPDASPLICIIALHCIRYLTR